jgi:hypothetical protein
MAAVMSIVVGGLRQQIPALDGGHDRHRQAHRVGVRAQGAGRMRWKASASNPSHWPK